MIETELSWMELDRGACCQNTNCAELYGSQKAFAISEINFRRIYFISSIVPITMKLNLAAKSLILPSVSPVDADGLHSIDTWTLAPSPSSARPYHPSMVTWKRGMGETETDGILEMASAVLENKPNFYHGRVKASLAVIRAYQVLHRENEIPKDLLDNFGGSVPELKGNHYSSLTQIVRTGPDCTRMAEAMEQEAKVPYVTQVGASFTANYTVNGKDYTPTIATRNAVRDASFISGAAALVASNRKESPVADTNTDAKRIRTARGSAARALFASTKSAS